MLIHADQREVQCVACGTKYPRSPDLKEHQKPTGRCHSIMNECLKVIYETQQPIQEVVVNKNIQIPGNPKIVDDDITNIQKSDDSQKHAKLTRNKNSCPKYGKMARHMRVHDKEKGSRSLTKKKFTCDTCHYRSFRKDHMKRHMSVHSEQRNFQCHACGSKFKTKDCLNTHQKKNGRCLSIQTRSKLKSSEKELRSLSKKKFVCDICHYRSGDKSHMRDHMLVHSYVYAFHCDACDKKFKRKRALNAHEKRTGCLYSGVK